MSQVPSTPTSSINFETVFTAALEAYQRQTKKDIASHPLAAQLRSCDSPSAILAVLRTQVQTFDQSRTADERWTKWLDPTVNVLYAFSATLGNGVGLIFPPSNAIFAGIGVLLQAVKDVRVSENAVVDLFGRLEYFFKRLEKYIEVRPTAAMMDIIVKIMVEVLSILGIVTKEIGQGRTKKYLKKLVGRTDVEDALQRLDALTQEEARMAAAEALAITRGIDDKVKDVGDKVECVDEKVQVVGIKVDGIDDKVRTVDDKVQGVDHKIGSVIQGVKETGVAIQQVVNQVTDLNRNKLRKDLRKWIAPPDPSVNYNTASGAHHEGTAAWCTKGTLAEWKTSGSLLWIHGKPGSGKSILSSVIIKSVSNAGSALLAYFYFDFKDTTKQDSRAMLSSLLVQLSDQSDVFCDALFSLYSAHKRGSEQPTEDSLAQCLKDMLTMTGKVPVYLIMDALDESPNDSGIPSSREKVLKLMKEIVDLHHPHLRLCVTSRPEFDIRTALELLATQELSLHEEIGQKQDINDYITSVVHSDRRMKRWRDDDKDAVIENLTKKADGMFRWVFCQLEVLRHCFPTNLRRILDELPKSLDETYKRILKEINNANREHAYRLLQCLAVASRPLRIEELAEVLAFDLSTGGISKLITDWRWEDQEEAVLSACSSLVSVVIDAGTRVVQFSHFSVKEFLISDRLASCEEVSRFHIPIEPSHAILAQACLGALYRLDDRTDRNSVKDIPLFHYASAYWVEHAKVGNVESQIEDAMDYFFDTDRPHFSAWARMQDSYLLDSYSNLWTYTRQREVPRSAGPLYFAAASGFRGLVQRLVVKLPQHINGWGSKYDTPLHASVLGGYLEVAQLLLAHGADINSCSPDKRTPLHLASTVGHLEAGKWLLARGADVNSRAKNGLTPLHYAAAHGHLEVSQMLLERSAGVNAKSDDHSITPLFSASLGGHTNVVQLLLDHNADIRHDKGVTPLHCAAYRGHSEVAWLLLERNAGVNARDNNGFTPLHRAAQKHEKRSSEVVQLLLDHNADARVRNYKGNTPLHYAAANAHLEIAQLLLEHNAEVNSQNDEGLTPLHRASDSGEGSLEVVRLLLDHNADSHVRDNKGNTPLHNGTLSLEIARLLLERNAAVNVQNDDGLTPFIRASEGGCTDVVQLLLDHNANERVSDNEGKTPLHHAVANGNLNIARLLLERNVEVNVRDNNGITPFLVASGRKNPDILQLLLDHGADEHVRDNNGLTPLHLAAANCRLDVARLLLERNAEVNARDHNGFTPLLRASASWDTPVLRLLLCHNADEHVRDNEGNTPLHYAAANGSLQICRLLLGYDMEVYPHWEDHDELEIEDEIPPFSIASERSIRRVDRLDIMEIADSEPPHPIARRPTVPPSSKNGPEINSQNDEGSTPLHRASEGWQHGYPDVVRLLLYHGADARIRNLNGKTASEVARGPKQQEIVQLFAHYAAE